MALRAFVTGGGGGLGQAICRELAKAGADVAIGYRSNARRAEALAADLETSGRSAFPVRIDIEDEISVTAAVEEAARGLGGLSVLINNAGAASLGHDIQRGDLANFTPEIWNRLLAINVTGPYLTTRAAVDHLRASGEGRVVNLGSTIGHGPWSAHAIYAPSKGSVLALTRFLAAALAPDISVNMVSPGLMEGTDLSGAAPESYKRAWRDRALTGKTTAAEDVARQVVAVIASPSMTGQSIVVDGGIHFD